MILTQTVPIKFIAQIVSGGTPKNDAANWSGDVPFVTPPDLNGLDGAVIEEWGRTITEVGKSQSAVVRNAVMLSCRAPIGHIGTATREVAFNQGCKAIIPDHSEDLRFLAYCLVAHRTALQVAGRGTTFLELSTTDLAALAIPWPTPAEREHIADYLDRETGEIDAMLVKMDELTETLEARRATAVTASVSGADFTDRVATRNTWFPTVPREWKLSSVQLLSKALTDGAHVSPETDSGVFDFVSTKDIRNGVIDFAGSLKTSASSYAAMVRTGCRPRPGDVLYSKDGTIGETALVAEDHDFVVASSLIIIRSDRDLVDPKYLQYALRSTPARKAARSFTRGAGLPRISIANFGRGVAIPLPPIDEQARIADHLDEVTGKIDQMLAKTAELKSLLVERRSALITDVVTGKKQVHS